MKEGSSVGNGFADLVHVTSRRIGGPVLQPRMGFASVAAMHAGLLRVRRADATTVGTITLDSFTRVGDHEAAREALESGAQLNGFPIVAHDERDVREMINDVCSTGFVVQVRHGSCELDGMFSAMARSGLDATEGGPVSYCLPYTRIPLSQSVQRWKAGCAQLVEASSNTPHLESFGGCMMGQLCPPSLLIAISVLEGLFFRQNGIVSVSLSYAQQTNPSQDVEALFALRRLARDFLQDIDYHLVLYSFMGLFPRTQAGAQALSEDALRIAECGGVERMIVKTAVESHRVPTVADNVSMLEYLEARRQPASSRRAGSESGGATYMEARALVDTVLELSDDIGLAFERAFARQVLDVPFCMHPDNANRARPSLRDDGTLGWAGDQLGPASGGDCANPPKELAGDELLRMLRFNARHYDDLASGNDAPSGGSKR